MENNNSTEIVEKCTDVELCADNTFHIPDSFFDKYEEYGSLSDVHGPNGPW